MIKFNNKWNSISLNKFQEVFFSNGSFINSTTIIKILEQNNLAIFCIMFFSCCHIRGDSTWVFLIIFYCCFICFGTVRFQITKETYNGYFSIINKILDRFGGGQYLSRWSYF